MTNREDVLKRILLNMRYDSRMTLNENYNVLVEQEKSPSVEVGPLQNLGIVPNEPEKPKNGSVINTIDYNGKKLTFFGVKDKTIQEKINEWSNKLESLGVSTYRDTPIEITAVEYIGPEWCRGMYNSYKANKVKLDDLKKKCGESSLKYTKKTTGWNYTKDTIGYVASRCRASLQVGIKRDAEKQKLYNYHSEEWYLEPTSVLDCTKKSIKTMFDGLNKNGLFSFWATSPNTNEKNYYYLSFSCYLTTEDSFRTFQEKSLDPKAKPVMVAIPTKCDSSSMNIKGYKSPEGKEWEKTKSENKKIVDNLTKQKPTDLVTQRNEKGSIQGSELGSSSGEEGGDNEITLDLDL